MSPFRLVTLGSVYVEGSQWRPGKVLALLAYLSVQGPTSRRRLRELFWPDAQDPGASLRVLLGQVRRQLPGAVAGEETVELRLSSDASELLGLSVAGAGSEDTLDLYGGPFLAGLELTDVSAELHEWVLDTRDRLAAAARLAAVRAAELAGSPAEAGRWAKRAAAIPEGPPMEPELIERLLRLALPGSLLETDLRREQAEYREQPSSVRPDPEGEPELLGRERELDGLLLALTDPEVRLLEITGPGGIGKSMLAAALLREQADLSGVQVVGIPLETAHAASEVAARLAAALNLNVTDRGDGWLAFTQSWGERPLLMLLDGAEGLPDLQRGVQMLLAACPGVRVVVTSRVRRLTLAGATGSVHLALDGLRVPVAGDPPERVARSAAVQLFVRGARRYLPRFALDEATLPLVSSIVRRLEGHPLATVLSATWIRVYPLARIHTQILHDLTALRAENGSGDRHHLSAVFDHSWRLLEPAEAQAVAALAVFRGFTPAAAKAVADISVETLDALKRHSMLRELQPDSQGTQRLEVPAVLAAQAQTLLDDVHGVRAAHSTYYLDLLMGHAPESDAVNDERDNIVAAAGFAVSQGQEVSAQIDVLLASYDRRGLFANGSDAFRALQEALLDEESPTAGSIFIGLSWLAVRSLRYAEAEQLSLVILGHPQTFGDQLQMKANNIVAGSRMQRADAAGSIPFYERALELAEGLDDLWRQVMYAVNIGVAMQILGEYADAERLVRRMAARFQGELPDELNLLIDGFLVSVGYYSASRPREQLIEEYRVYLNRYRNLSLAQTYIVTKLIYISLLLDVSEIREAEERIRDLTAIFMTTQTPDLELANRVCGIRLLYLRHRIKSARKEAVEVLSILRELNEHQGICELILACGRDLLESDAALGRNALGLVTEVLPSTHFQVSRAVNLLNAVEDKKFPPHIDVNEVLNKIQTLFKADHVLH